MKLYEISEQYEDTLSELSAMEGLTDEVIKDTMASIEGEFKDKAINVGAYIRSRKALIAVAKEEKARIDKLIKSEQKAVDGLEDYLRHNMNSIKLESIENGVHSIKLGAASKKLELTNPDKLPDEYIIKIYEEKPDKKLITQRIKEGEEIEGAQLVDGKQRLTIK